MHILVANNIYPPIMAGGAELIVSYLCEGLAARGHQVTVVSTCGPEMEPYPVESRNGVEIIRFFPRNLYWSFARYNEPPIRRALWHLRDSWNGDAARRFRAVIARRRPDVVNTHLIDGFSASIWAMARRDGIPVLHTAHDYHLLCPRAFLLTREWKLCTAPSLGCRAYRQWHLNSTRHVNMFASPSKFLLDRHVAAGLAVPQVKVLHNGIPQPTAMADVRRRRGMESRARFLMLTRLTVEKGVRVLIDAVTRLPASVEIEVAIAGTGPLEAELRAAAERDPRIKFLGYVADDAKRDALARAGYLLLPSLWYENAPVTMVEAAAYGLGVIGSDIGGIPEFLEPGRTGLLFPPGDSQALADILRRLAGDGGLPDLAVASARMAAQFTVERMVDQYEEAYRGLTRPTAAQRTRPPAMAEMEADADITL